MTPPVIPVLLLQTTFVFLCTCKGGGILLNTKSILLENCLKFKKSSMELIQMQSSPQLYQKLNYQWNTHVEPIFPLGYLLPATVQDVQTSIKCGRLLKIRMVARSGGHSFEKYSFGNSESVVLDMSKFSKIDINQATSTVQVGSGVILGQLYWKLWSNGKFALPVGTCTTVGIGGLTLGGGLGLLTQIYGLTSDNALKITMVDAASKVRITNQSSNSDLFWALRGGGGGNFGVATEFQFKIFDVSALSTFRHQLTYNFQDLTSVYMAFQKWADKNRYGSSQCWLTIYHDRVDLQVIEFNSSNPKNILKDFPSPFLSQLAKSPSNFIDLIVAFSDPVVNSPPELAQLTIGNVSQSPYYEKSYFCSKQLSRNQIEELREVIRRMPYGIFVRLISAGYGQGGAVPKNATAYVHRDSFYSFGIVIKTKGHNRWIKEMDASVLSTLDNGESYQNIVDAELGKTYLRRYYERNLDRLVQIKTKFDPSNYFSFKQSIPLVPSSPLG